MRLTGCRKRITTELPILEEQAYNPLLLLLCSNNISHRQQEVLDDWANSLEGRQLYYQLIKDIKIGQRCEQLTVLFCAVARLQRLRRFDTRPPPAPLCGTYLADLDALFLCISERIFEDLWERRSSFLFDRMIDPLIRVSGSLAPQILWLPAAVLEDDYTPLLNHFDGLTDQYLARRFDGHDHRKAMASSASSMTVIARARA